MAVTAVTLEMSRKYPAVQETWIHCDCHDPEHSIRFTHDKVEHSLSMDIHLTDYPGFLGRLWKGIRYIFGYRCRYGNWDCISINRESAAKISNVVDLFLLETDFAFEEEPQDGSVPDYDEY